MTPAYTAKQGVALRRSLETWLDQVIRSSESSLADSRDALANEILRRILTESRAMLQFITENVSKTAGFSEEEKDALFRDARVLMSDAMNLPAGNPGDLDRIRTGARELVNLTSSRPTATAAPGPPSPRVLVRGDSTPAQARLLLVDPDDNSRELFRKHLDSRGYFVEQASSGKAALQFVRTASFDAVLVDVSAPEVLDGVRDDAAMSSTPVLILSSPTKIEAIADALRRGAEDFLLKPFDPVLVDARLRATLERRRLRRLEDSGKLALEKVTDALQRSNEDLQRFAYAASHDLQAPVRTITTYLQLLDRRLGSRLAQDEREMIDFARAAARRMHTLIQDLLLYSRAGTATLSIQQINCQELLETVIDDLKVLIDEAGAQITFDQLPVISADLTGLRLVLLNLITNAIKYRDEAPLRIHVTATAENGYWRFCVQDNGQGIPSEYSGQIFDMFKRLHGDAIPGSGIGLSICKRIVERVGGKIWVASEPGRGSTFCFTIPAADAVA